MVLPAGPSLLACWLRTVPPTLGRRRGLTGTPAVPQTARPLARLSKLLQEWYAR